MCTHYLQIRQSSGMTDHITRASMDQVDVGVSSGVDPSVFDVLKGVERQDSWKLAGLRLSREPLEQTKGPGPDLAESPGIQFKFL